MSAAEPSSPTIAQAYAAWGLQLDASYIPDTVREAMTRLLLDAGGLIVAARYEPYVQAVAAARDGHGSAVVPGHVSAYTLTDAAMVAGTSIHGEDFDDTFEGTPVHVGAVVVPAVLAVAQSEGSSGADVLKALAVGGELMCRMAVVAPTAIHRAGFHPTAVVGALGAAAAVAVLLKLSNARFASALGIAGSMASGIIEYLAEGTSTKRLHPGWAAAAGLRAARLAREGFTGPRTVFDGTHGFFKAFADPGIPADLSHLTRALGDEWYVSRLAFKPYACGTMIQPFIDCAMRLREQVADLDKIEKITAYVGEGTVHRLWEPVSEKARPSTPYSAKFSGPYGIAIGLHEGKAGLEQFTRERLALAQVQRLAESVQYVVDPENEYPRNYTAIVKVHLHGGETLSAEQDCLRGGVRAPLSDDELIAKYYDNTRYGGWPTKMSAAFHEFVSQIFALESAAKIANFRDE